MSETKISAFMICKNEEAMIEKALLSLSWANEIVIVDDHSTDRTLDIVKKYTDQIYVREFTNFAEQRNYALSKTRNPWVFFLDADEVCSADLINWFEEFKTKGPVGMAHTVTRSTSSHPMGTPELVRVDLYEIRRLEHFRGRIFRYGLANPSHQWRFFRREQTIFRGGVLDYPVVRGLILRLERPIYHFPKTSLAQCIDKMNHMTTAEANQLYEERVVHHALYMFSSGFGIFLKAFIRKQGFRDNALGFILAVLDAGQIFLRQAKLYIKNRAAGRV